MPADQDKPLLAVWQRLQRGGIGDLYDRACKRQADALFAVEVKLFEKIGLEDVRRICAHHRRSLGRAVALVNFDAEFYLKFLADVFV